MESKDSFKTNNMKLGYLLLILSFCFGAIFTWLVRWFALRLHVVNKPNPIVPQHVKPVAYLGGAGILLAVMATIGIALLFNHDAEIIYTISSKLTPLLFGTIAYTAFGTYDDLVQLKPLPKFIGQAAIAIICVALGLETNLGASKIINVLFSVFWILFVINALNFTDVCDGLVGTICVVSFFIIGLLRHDLTLYCFIIAGASGGFLLFNFPKASIFLGDGGSHLLGFLLAAAGINGSINYHFVDAIIWMILIAGIPVFELIFITTVRINKGLPWWKGSPEHFSLRMQQGGFSRTQINLITAVLSALMVWIGCIFVSLNISQKIFSSFVLAIIFGFGSMFLLRWEVRK